MRNARRAPERGVHIAAGAAVFFLAWAGTAPAQAQAVAHGRGNSASAASARLAKRAAGGPSGAGASAGARAQVVPLEDWSYKQLYKGVTAKDLLAATVGDPHGKPIGKVENLMLDRQGQLVAVVTHIGGVWIFGGTDLAIPWNRIDLLHGRKRGNLALQVPITKRDARRYRRDDDYFSQSDRDWYARH